MASAGGLIEKKEAKYVLKGIKDLIIPCYELSKAKLAVDELNSKLCDRPKDVDWEWEA
jgi:hypothetical protein